MGQHHLDNYNHELLVLQISDAISIATPTAIHGVNLAALVE